MHVHVCTVPLLNLYETYCYLKDKKIKVLHSKFYFIVDNFCVHNLLVEDGRCADILNTFCVKNGVNFLCFL